MLIDINLYQLTGTTKPTGWMEFQPVGFALPYSCSFCSGSAADRICGIVKGLCHAAGILRGHQVLHHVVDGGAHRKLVFGDGELVQLFTLRCPRPKLPLELFTMPPLSSGLRGIVIIS